MNKIIIILSILILLVACSSPAEKVTDTEVKATTTTEPIIVEKTNLDQVPIELNKVSAIGLGEGGKIENEDYTIILNFFQTSETVGELDFKISFKSPPMSPGKKSKFDFNKLWVGDSQMWNMGDNYIRYSQLSGNVENKEIIYVLISNPELCDVQKIDISVGETQTLNLGPTLELLSVNPIIVKYSVLSDIREFTIKQNSIGYDHANGIAHRIYTKSETANSVSFDIKPNYCESINT